MKEILVVLALASSATAAQALVLCTMPDGKSYAGDTPPPGCQVKSQYASPPAEPATSTDTTSDADSEADRKAAASNAVEAQALTARRRLETEINRAADDLVALRAQMASGSSTAVAAFQQAINGVTQQGGGASETLPDLRARERALLAEIDGYKKQYSELTERLAKERGSLPPSWPRALRCDRCP